MLSVNSYYGWLPDIPDKRDHRFSAINLNIGELPTSVDLRPQCPPVYNQGQLGSCFTGDTLVTMGDLTEKYIKDIELGEYISNQYGIKRQVTRKYERNYTGELYNIKVKGLGHTLYMTSEHPIAIRYSLPRKINRAYILHDTIEYIQAKDIDLSKTPCIVIPKTISQDPSSYIIDMRKLLEDELVFDEETQKVRVIGGKDRCSIPVKFELTSDLMRLIGLFLAEGSYRKDTSCNLNGINFTFDRKEQDLVEFVEKTILTVFGLNVEIKKTDRRPSVTDVSISNTTVARIFRKLCGEFSFGKELSPLLFKQSRKNKLELLRGWIDGDGINKTKFRYKNIKSEEIRSCQVEGVTISKRLVRDMFRLAISCGLKPSLSIKNNTKYGKVESYILYLFGMNALELYPEFKDILFKNGVNIGGQCGYRSDENNFYCRIESIEKRFVENIPVYNLEVEKDNVYIANFCLVHNCTANAIGGAIEFDLLKQKLDDFTPSRLFIYYNERDMEGTVSSDSGAMIRDGVKSVNSLGACRETTWPYNIPSFTDKPNPTAYNEALAHPVIIYQRIPRDLPSMKGCLASGYPFIFGFTVYDNFESVNMMQTGVLDMPNQNMQILGGHAVMAVGYDDTTQRFIVRNSWGDKWGLSGYFTIPYAYLLDEFLSDDFWTIQLIK